VKEPAELDCPTHSALLEVEEEEEEGAAVAAVEPSRTAKFYFAPDPFLMCLQTSKVAAADESERKIAISRCQSCVWVRSSRKVSFGILDARISE
jgi:hypothetical protein